MTDINNFDVTKLTFEERSSRHEKILIKTYIIEVTFCSPSLHPLIFLLNPFRFTLFPVFTTQYVTSVSPIGRTHSLIVGVRISDVIRTGHDKLDISDDKED